MVIKNFHKNLKNYTQKRLEEIDIKINGDRPWDLQVYNDDFYWRIFLYGSLGLGEAYTAFHSFSIAW